MKSLNIKKYPLASLIAVVLFITVLVSSSAFSARAENYSNWQKFGAFKTASQRQVAPGETLTYTISLYNSDVTAHTALVIDPIPSELLYVADSATGGGVYDPDTKTLTWQDVAVPAISGKTFEFKVVPALAEISEPQDVTNTATVTTELGTINPSVKIALVPEALKQDQIRPVVNSVLIDNQDVLDTQDVTLHIDASDNVGVVSMYIKEWAVNSSPIRWQQVQKSGWIPFNAEAPWKLSENDGVHFIGVWVADAALNTSLPNEKGFDYANIVQPEAVLTPGAALPGMLPYLVHFDTNTAVKAVLEPLSGNPDMYVWTPGNFATPDFSGKTVEFTTEKEGAYLFLAAAPGPASYNLNITPAGGPSPWNTTFNALPSLNTAGTDGSSSINYANIFGQSGANPISQAYQPVQIHRVYTPIIRGR